MGAQTPSTGHGKPGVEARVQRLEERLEQLLQGKIDLEVVDSQDLAVSPRSKLRVACE